MQRARAASYQPGDVIRHSRGSRTIGIKAGDYVVVQTAEVENHRLRVATRDGRAAEYDPRRLKGLQVFREEPRAFAQGERIQIRLPDRKLGIANGQFATITALDSATGDATLTLSRGRQLIINLRSFPHVDHGYAVTSHASQGATVDHVIVNVDTTRSRELVNRQQFYVSLSRARHDAVIFTDSRESLPRAISRTADKGVALDAIEGIQMRQKTSGTRLRAAMTIVTPREHISHSDYVQSQHQSPRMKA